MKKPTAKGTGKGGKGVPKANTEKRKAFNKRQKGQPSNCKGKTWKRKDGFLWVSAFLRYLSKSGNIRRSCEQAGVSRGLAAQHRLKDDSFRDAWDSAMEDACDLLEEEAWRRARKDSDTLLIFLLKVHKGYQNTQNIELTGKDGGPIEHQVLAMDERKNFLLAVCSALLGKESENENGHSNGEVLEGRLKISGPQTTEEDQPHRTIQSTNGTAVPPHLEPPTGSAE